MLLNALAKQMGVKLKIENLDFNGLIPGLAVEEVRHGLGRPLADAGAQEGDRLQPRRTCRTRDPGGAEGRHDARDDVGVERLEQDDHLAAGLDRASSSCRSCSRRRSDDSFPDQNAAFLQVATGRASGIVVENYLLAQFNKSNGNKLDARSAFKKPLHVQYGAYAVQKGNGALVADLNKFICSVQGNGQLAKIYKQTEGTTLPPMPHC